MKITFSTLWLLYWITSVSYGVTAPNSVAELQEHLNAAQEQVEELSTLMQTLKREMKSQEDDMKSIRAQALSLTQAGKQKQNANEAEVKALRAKVAELEAIVTRLNKELAAKNQAPPPTGVPQPTLPAVEIPPVYFGLTNTQLSADYERVWTSVSKILRATPDVTFRLTGHSNREGNEDVNYRQSAMRAQSLAKFLTGRGLPAAKLQIVAAGTAHLLHEADSTLGRQRNRRVEIEVLRK